ncbi:uncharacterized protein [Amphiura filiformis]|uniref:uncharacterized protein n=1 Tax=Amphiura filiformis TaxID=82378 RepID=UPI003B226349
MVSQNIAPKYLHSGCILCNRQPRCGGMRPTPQDYIQTYIEPSLRDSNRILARLQSTIKGSRVEKILHNTERKLLNERIRQINYTINKLNTKKEEISGELETQLPLETYKRVQEFTAHAQLSQHEKTKTRQVAKFGRLVSSGRADKDTNWRCKEDKSAHNIRDSRWVKNLSDRPLSSNEQSLLEKGLNFAVTSKRVQVTDIITATESAIRNARLGPANAEELRSRVSASVISAKPPQHNLSKAEFTALESLKKNKDIAILPADKGRCTVVLNSTDYDKKAKELLGDTKTYTTLNKDPTSGIKRKIAAKLNQFLEKDKVIDIKLKHQLYPTSETIPTFYGLPKVHKASVPLRAIVSSIGSVTYNIAKYLAKIVGPLVGKSKHHIWNSKDFAEKIQGIVLDADETITSFDVTALFTSIPPADAVLAVRDVLKEDKTLSYVLSY